MTYLNPLYENPSNDDITRLYQGQYFTPAQVQDIVRKLQPLEKRLNERRTDHDSARASMITVLIEKIQSDNSKAEFGLLLAQTMISMRKTAPPPWYAPANATTAELLNLLRLYYPAFLAKPFP